LVLFERKFLHIRCPSKSVKALWDNVDSDDYHSKLMIRIICYCGYCCIRVIISGNCY